MGRTVHVHYTRGFIHFACTIFHFVFCLQSGKYFQSKIIDDVDKNNFYAQLIFQIIVTWSYSVVTCYMIRCLNRHYIKHPLDKFILQHKETWHGLLSFLWYFSIINLMCMLILQNIYIIIFLSNLWSSVPSSYNPNSKNYNFYCLVISIYDCNVNQRYFYMMFSISLLHFEFRSTYTIIYKDS